MNPTERLTEALATIASTAELMKVTSVQVQRTAELMSYGDPVVNRLTGERYPNPQFGDVVEVVTIRYRGQLRPAPATDPDPDAQDDAEPANVLRVTGDWAEVLTDLIRRARPHDRIDIEPTGQTSPGITLPLGTDWLAEARELAEDMLGRRLVQTAVWTLED